MNPLIAIPAACAVIVVAVLVATPIVNSIEGAAIRAGWIEDRRPRNPLEVLGEIVGREVRP